MLVRTVYYLVLTALMGAAAVTDIKKREIPNAVPLLILAAGTAKVIIDIMTGEYAVRIVISAVFGAFLGIALMLIPAMKHKMGGGDVKLSGAAGLGIGFPYVLHFLLISLLIAALYGLIQYLHTRRKELTVPLAPFLAGGALCLTVSGAVDLLLHY